MFRRLLTLVLVLTFAGAPVVIEACQAACAATDEHGSAASHVAMDHTCHDVAVSLSAITRADVHLCGHDNELPSAPQGTPHGLDAPDVVATVVASPPQQDFCAAPSVPASPSPPERAARTTQIRV